MRTRPSKLTVAMNVASCISELSHDEETQVGSVLIKQETGTIIATGYNGFVRGAPDDQLPSTRPDKYSYIIHSEENLILNCAMNGISMKDTFVICTLTPCVHCMRLLYNAGVRKVIARNKYKDFDTIIQMKDIEIKESITPEGFIELTYTRYA